MERRKKMGEKLVKKDYPKIGKDYYPLFNYIQIVLNDVIFH